MPGTLTALATVRAAHARCARRTSWRPPSSRELHAEVVRETGVVADRQAVKDAAAVLGLPVRPSDRPPPPPEEPPCPR